MRINIAVATDQNYIRQTYILITSILEASNTDDCYFFNIMTDKDVPVESEETLRFLMQKYSHAHIRFIQMSEQAGSRIKTVNIHLKHITRATYFRLLLPELIDEDKCLYLDTDMIVCGDISELYGTPLDGYELAGVKAPQYHNFPDHGKEYCERTGIPSMEQYINAGVLLLNLSLMRKNQFTQKAMCLAGRFFPTQDQDIINRVSYGRIRHLPLKFNMPASYHLNWNTELIKSVFSWDEWKEGISAPCIIHYSSADKPWKNFAVPFADKWWEMCRTAGMFSDFFEETQDNFYYHGIICQQPLWRCAVFSEQWCCEVKKYADIYVYGAGGTGKKVIQKLRYCNIFISAVLVSKMETKAEDIEGILIKEFSDQIDRKALIIIAVSDAQYIGEIKEVLFQKGYFNVYVLHRV